MIESIKININLFLLNMHMVYMEMISRLTKVSMRLDRPKLFGLLMEVEDGFNELAVAAHNKQSDIRHFLKLPDVPNPLVTQIVSVYLVSLILSF
jgi:hypothetical protein